MAALLYFSDIVYFWFQFCSHSGLSTIIEKEKKGNNNNTFNPAVTDCKKKL